MRDLFEILNILFENPIEWEKITNGEKTKNFFLINRRMAIMYPQEANVLQLLKINQGAVVEFWQRFIRVKKKYTKLPGWMYTKGVKKSLDIKEKKLLISKNVIDEYSRINQIDRKSIYEALEFFPTEMLAELKSYEKLLKQ